MITRAWAVQSPDVGKCRAHSLGSCRQGSRNFDKERGNEMIPICIKTKLLLSIQKPYEFLFYWYNTTNKLNLWQTEYFYLCRSFRRKEGAGLQRTKRCRSGRPSRFALSLVIAVVDGWGSWARGCLLRLDNRHGSLRQDARLVGV